MSNYEPGTVAVATVRGVPRALYYTPEHTLPWVIATTAGRIESPSNYDAADLPDFRVVAVPKPEEPTGLGAVVEAVHRNYFVRESTGDHPWRRVSDRDDEHLCQWRDIDVVKVHSEGWSE